ncbi:helix-turn-helix domain-containing protein [Pedobacter agri]|uniref:helix-turn-helix domain-containing protein n=1 Tax=Pedobacter agri TaxID=454586 RepID=UPI00292F6906|nr:helix-turn-helix domain-containing protein [Pedobacter agri]
MKYNDGQFVCLPQILNLKENGLKYTDILVYVALRSFDKLDGCFPMYETIAERANCSRDYVIKAVNRLKAVEFITVMPSAKRTEQCKSPINKYEFKEYYMFERIHYSIFDADLNLHDKAMILNLRQFFAFEMIKPFYTLKQIAKELGLTYKVVTQRVNSLIRKGYMERTISTYKKRKPQKKYKFTDKMEWIWNYSKFDRSFIKTDVKLIVG